MYSTVQSDTSQPESILQSSLRLLYSDHISDAATRLYKRSGEDMKIYIVGCLLLTLTASVQPQYTLLEQRKRSFQLQAEAAASASGLPPPADDLAEAGFYQPDPDRLVCFHCSAKVARRALADSSPLDEHRAASPNCYFVRFIDFVASHGANPRLAESVQRDIGRYLKALRKLYQDLACEGIGLAASYGYSQRQIAFCATRQFMRNSGRFSNRSGDLIELAQRFEPLFSPVVFDTVDVRQLLEPIKLFTLHGVSGAAASAAAPAAASAAAASSASSTSTTAAASAAASSTTTTTASVTSNSSNYSSGIPQPSSASISTTSTSSTRGSSRGVGGESGYYSILIGRYDQRSGAWESSSQSLTDEQLRAIEAVIGASTTTAATAATAAAAQPRTGGASNNHNPNNNSTNGSRPGSGGGGGQVD